MDLSNVELMPVIYLNCVFEVSLLYIFLKGLFSVREEHRGIKILKALICITVMFIINNYRQPWLNLICVPIIYFVYVRLNFYMELKFTILYVIFYYIILAGAEFAFSYVYKLFEIDVTTADFGRVLILAIQDVFEFVIIQLVKRQHRGPYEDDSYQYLKTMFLLPITALILLNGILIPYEYHMIGYVLVCIGGILLVVSIMLNFSIVERLLSTLREAKNEEMLNMKTHLERLHLQRLEEVNSNYAKAIHEMKRYLRTLEQLACENENGIINELSMKLLSKEFQEKKVYSRDPIVNAILLEREKMAEDSEIDFNVDVQDGLNLDFIDDLDKITMFGNILDNALEAAEDAADGYVSVSLYMGNYASIIFRVENNFKIKPIKKGKEYITIKRVKKEHGFGLKNVKELSEKYGGMFDCNDSENESTFTAMLILSNMQKMSNTEI